ncbi:hypothetical protein [Mucilaginibacter sp.]|uniref:hypothetical protein n=1 Tax=Mucilaginibacter sp. TaxID=1882438 RepID=UPI0026066A76|nr:hypothetical protein [Mucilaginibacter sp.]
MDDEIKPLTGLPELDFWSQLPAEVEQAINEAKEELKRGEGIPHSEVMEEIKSRFTP